VLLPSAFKRTDRALWVASWTILLACRRSFATLEELAPSQKEGEYLLAFPVVFAALFFQAQRSSFVGCFMERTTTMFQPVSGVCVSLFLLLFVMGLCVLNFGSF
jgi:hypothetical protein